jgi:hypothetical protein
MPEEIRGDLQKRHELLGCAEWDLNKHQAFVASMII